MNLYDLHPKPSTLKGYDKRFQVPELAYEQALKYGNRTPKLEQSIIRSPEYAHKYAFNVLKKRWLEAEPIIATDPHWAVVYAFQVIHGKFPEAEPVIIKSPLDAFLYAIHVLRRRWPEAEPVIAQGPENARTYSALFKVKL